MDDKALKQRRARRRRRRWPSKYETAISAGDALHALWLAFEWLEELEAMPQLGFDGEHCVVEAEKELRKVRLFLSLLTRGEE